MPLQTLYFADFRLFHGSRRYRHTLFMTLGARLRLRRFMSTAADGTMITGGNFTDHRYQLS